MIKREYLAVFKNKGGSKWYVATREPSTKIHALKMAEEYKLHGHEAGITKIGTVEPFTGAIVQAGTAS